MSIGGLPRSFGTKPGAIAVALRPLVEAFPYTYEDVSQLFESYRKSMTDFGAMCNGSLEGCCTNEELAEAREAISVHKLVLSLRYPDIGRVRGDANPLPDRIDEVLVTPESLTLYANSRSHFQVVGVDGSRRYTIVVYEDDKVFVEVDNHPE